MQDTKTPVKIGVAALLTNIVLNLILMRPMKEAGLALATSISGILQFVLLARLYRKQISDFAYSEILISFGKIALASIGMGFVAVTLYNRIDFLSDNLFGHALRLGLAMAGASVSYLVFCLLLRVHEVKEAWQWMKSRRLLRPRGNASQ